MDFDAAIDAMDAKRARRPAPDLIEADAERRAFLVRRPWLAFKARLEDRLERTETRSRLNWTLWFSGLAFACSAAVVLITVLSQPRVAPTLPSHDGIGMKGGGGAPVVVSPIPTRLFVLADGVVIDDGATLAAGAELTFRVDSGAFDHVLVFSVEAAGTMRSYYPEDESGQSLAIGRGRGQWLPDSVELDDSLSSELLIAIFSSKPLRWSRVRVAAQGALRASGGLLNSMPRLELPDTEEARVWFAKSR